MNNTDFTGITLSLRTDFARVRFQTVAPTNLQSIQPIVNRALRLPKGKNASIDVLDKGSGGSASIFETKIHDPTRWGDVADTIAALCHRVRESGRELVAEPVVTALEIALDIRRPGASKDDLGEMLASLYTYSTFVAKHPGCGRGRYAHRMVTSLERTAPGLKPATVTMGDDEMPAHFGALVRMLADGGNIYIGNQEDDKHGRWKADDLSSHLYVKTTDQSPDGSGTIALDPEKWSARYEHRIQGSALASFKFDDLGRFFNFRKLRGDLPPLLVASLHGRVLPGFFQLKDRRQRGRCEPRKHSRAGVADAALNKRVADAVRRLARRWSGYENLRRFSSANPCACSDSGALPINCNYTDRSVSSITHASLCHQAHHGNQSNVGVSRSLRPDGDLRHLLDLGALNHLDALDEILALDQQPVAYSDLEEAFPDLLGGPDSLAEVPALASR